MDHDVTTNARTPDATTGAGRWRDLLGVTAACLACCVPMLVLVGAVSLGAAVAGAVGLGVLVALVGLVAVLRRARR